MKILGSLLITLGLIWGLIAFNMTTSVKMESQKIGTDESSGYTQTQEIYNLSLASERNLHLTIAAVITVVGAILFGFGSTQTSANSNLNSRKCPYCAEAIQSEAIVCKHCKSDLSAIPKNPENLSEQELNKLIEKLKLK